MKQAIIAPGWPDSGKEDKYVSLEKSFRDQGYNTQTINFDWKQNKMSVLIDQINQAINLNSNSLTLLGFSMGGMAALIVASQRPVTKLIACSPSGYFNEYTPLLSDEDIDWTAENMTDFGQYSTADVYGKLKVANGYIIAGDAKLEEWPDFKQMIHDLEQSTGWVPTILPATGHDIGAPAYQETLLNIIKADSV